MHFDHQLRVRELQSTGVGMRVRDQNISFSASCAERGPPIWYSGFRPPLSPPAPSDEPSIWVAWPNRAEVI